MNEEFELPVVYKGKQLHLPAQLLQQGYVHRFLVQISGEDVLFEPDEEGAYRAMIDPAMINETKIEPGLLKEIADALSSL